MRLLAVGVCETNGKVLAMREFGTLKLPAVELNSENPRDELGTFFLSSLGIEVEIGKLFGEKYIESSNELFLYYLIPPLPQLKEANGVVWVKATEENLKKIDPAKTGESLSSNYVKEAMKLLDIMERTINKCPWGAKQTVEDALRELVSEIEEFRAELFLKDQVKASFEAGDVVYDALLLIWLFARDSNMSPAIILKKVTEKISKRKPWLFSDGGISLEEAEKLWEYYKSLGN
ncbi:hypothetical protein AT15_08140 [Kosmotoga arenicorallina S304]|uniref:NTP pyrophosphohydrolase MazG-like domain-containing protein n=1 Tax=Kosmotoga arenicorallina S304 TaxID=1453497 RepID=A0A176K3C8_9BACT|nr:MazG nucleotide pyrophosphohydrolase domain-containing protein [Kosmotoga arenicorallina]OAA31453.1 hypothetical protein AT15_08140 [Kosmotoga arenicorallina S304]